MTVSSAVLLTEANDCITGFGLRERRHISTRSPPVTGLLSKHLLHVATGTRPADGLELLIGLTRPMHPQAPCSLHTQDRQADVPVHAQEVVALRKRISSGARRMRLCQWLRDLRGWLVSSPRRKLSAKEHSCRQEAMNVPLRNLASLVAGPPIQSHARVKRSKSSPLPFGLAVRQRRQCSGATSPGYLRSALQRGAVGR